MRDEHGIHAAEDHVQHGQHEQGDDERLRRRAAQGLDEWVENRHGGLLSEDDD